MAVVEKFSHEEGKISLIKRPITIDDRGFFSSREIDFTNLNFNCQRMYEIGI